MKKLLISVILAVIVFAAVYVAQCYMVPGWRLKLAAPAMEYFAASLRHMVFLRLRLVHFREGSRRDCFR